MDHRRYWFKAIKEQVVVMVLGGNNGILVYLDINGFLGFTCLLDYTCFLGFFGFWSFQGQGCFKVKIIAEFDSFDELIDKID